MLAGLIMAKTEKKYLRIQLGVLCFNILEICFQQVSAEMDHLQVMHK